MNHSIPRTDVTSPANPTIHLNGNNGHRLFEQYQHALDRLSDAAAALNAVEFHSRDYYPVPGSWKVAVAEREQMFAKLAEVAKGLERIRESIHDQINPA
jgi:hypothetical protein